jgi:hypothetical protein
MLLPGSANCCAFAKKRWSHSRRRTSSPGSGLDEDAADLFVARAAFLTAFTVRKLSEAGKISVQFLGRSIPFMRHPIIDPTRVPDKFNMHRSLEFYTKSGV